MSHNVYIETYSIEATCKRRNASRPSYNHVWSVGGRVVCVLYYNILASDSHARPQNRNVRNDPNCVVAVVVGGGGIWHILWSKCRKKTGRICCTPSAKPHVWCAECGVGNTQHTKVFKTPLFNQPRWNCGCCWRVLFGIIQLTTTNL